MGIRIYRDGGWHSLKNGVIFRRDLLGLDPEKDRNLIGYLVRHAPPAAAASLRKYAAERYGMEELPERPVNLDDPDDPYYEAYWVLREQAEREDDPDVLEEAALHGSEYDLAAFAFCRLTGSRRLPGASDAYSYRTFRCEPLPGLPPERLRAFCERVVREGGRFRAEAKDCLRALEGKTGKEPR